MNEETLLQREEKQELFYRLVDLNERGKIHWECVEYISYFLHGQRYAGG